MEYSNDMNYLTTIEEYAEVNWYTILIIILFLIALLNQNEYLIQILLGGMVGTQVVKLLLSITRYIKKV